MVVARVTQFNSKVNDFQVTQTLSNISYSKLLFFFSIIGAAELSGAAE